MKIVKKILLIIVGIPVSIVSFALFTALFNILGGLLIVFILSAIICLLGGGAVIVFGITSVAGSSGAWILAISGGIITIAVSIIFVCLCIIFIKKVLPITVNFTIRLFQKLSPLFLGQTNMAAQKEGEML